MPNHLELLARIALGAILGGAIGFERNLHSRHVVLRTHLIVAMASAAFMVTSAFFSQFQGYDLIPKAPEVDASRIAASVVSGIGFLAGGVILKSGATVEGLTTAASMWLATAVGLMSGAGMFIESIAVAVMGVAALSFLRRFEEKKESFIHRKVSVTVGDEDDSTQFLQTMSATGVRMSHFDYEKDVVERKVIIKFEAHIPAKMGADAFIRQVDTMKGVKQVKVKLPG